MKARTKFSKMYWKLPREAKHELVYNFTEHPMTLAVCFHEIVHKTKLGDKILEDLGYKND